MKCPNCGAHIEETDKRCPYCNCTNEDYKKTELHAQPTQTDNHEEQGSNGFFGLKFWVFISALIFSIIFTLSFTCK